MKYFLEKTENLRLNHLSLPLFAFRADIHYSRHPSLLHKLQLKLHSLLTLSGEQTEPRSPQIVRI